MNNPVKELIKILPKKQLKDVLNQEICDIDIEFMGFIGIYKNLSQIIPQHFTIIDLGCAYNPQCFYFQRHKSYIAVDIDNTIKFKSKNCIIYEEGIEKFIQNEIQKYDLDETFVICSYVPLKDEINKLIRETFPNLFVFYPSNKKMMRILFK